MKLCHQLLLLSAIPPMAFAADPALLSLVPPGAKVVTGIEVTQAESSPLGQYLLSQMKSNSPGFNQFVATTGFDPRQDLSELIVASDGQPKSSSKSWLAIASGVFNVSKLTAAAQTVGATIQAYQGVNVLILPNRGNQQITAGVAFLDNATALMGDLVSVQTSIQQHSANAQASSSLLNQANSLSANDDFWFFTLVPPSQLTLPNSKLQSLLSGNAFATISQLSGGIQLSSTVTVSAKAVADSPNDAQALADVLKFVVGVVQMNQQKNAAAGTAATWLNTLDSTVAGNVVTMSMALPESQVEQMLQSSRQQGHGRRAKATQTGNVL